MGRYFVKEDLHRDVQNLLPTEDGIADEILSLTHLEAVERLLRVEDQVSKIVADGEASLNNEAMKTGMYRMEVKNLMPIMECVAELCEAVTGDAPVDEIQILTDRLRSLAHRWSENNPGTPNMIPVRVRVFNDRKAAR